MNITRLQEIREEIGLAVVSAHNDADRKKVEKGLIESEKWVNAYRLVEQRREELKTLGFDYPESNDNWSLYSYMFYEYLVKFINNENLKKDLSTDQYEDLGDVFYPKMKALPITKDSLPPGVIIATTEEACAGTDPTLTPISARRLHSCLQSALDSKIPESNNVHNFTWSLILEDQKNNLVHTFAVEFNKNIYFTQPLNEPSCSTDIDVPNWVPTFYNNMVTLKDDTIVISYNDGLKSWKTQFNIITGEWQALQVPEHL